MEVRTTPVGGAAGQVQAAGARPSHFERLGGMPAVIRLVDAFYAAMDARPDAAVIRAMHPADLGEVKVTLVKYLAQWTGGPTAYSEERGHPQLRRRHMPFAIGDAERDAWMACMRTAIAEVCSDRSLASSLIDAFQRTADFMRNAPPQFPSSTQQQEQTA